MSHTLHEPRTNVIGRDILICSLGSTLGCRKISQANSLFGKFFGCRAVPKRAFSAQTLGSTLGNGIENEISQAKPGANKMFAWEMA